MNYARITNQTFLLKNKPATFKRSKEAAERKKFIESHNFSISTNPETNEPVVIVSQIGRNNEK